MTSAESLMPIEPVCILCAAPAPPPPRTTCDDCRNRLVSENIGIARLAAHDAYRSSAIVRRLPLEDCLQEAMLSLITAAGRWMPSRGKLTTCAYRYIRHHLLEQARHGGVVSLPSKCGQRGQGTPDRAEAIRKAAESPVWLGDGKQQVNHRDVSSPDVVQPGGAFWGLVAMVPLTVRQRLLIHAVYARGWTMAMVAEMLGVTTRRARDIHKAALAKFKRAAEKDGSAPWRLE